MVELSWDADALAFFESLMQNGPPAAFVESATRAVQAAATKGARERNAGRVEIIDVAEACLRVAPPAFRPNGVAKLQQRGIVLHQEIKSEFGKS